MMNPVEENLLRIQEEVNHMMYWIGAEGQMLDLLQSLLAIPVTIELLLSTRIGVTINKLRRVSRNEEVVNLASTVVMNWRNTIDSFLRAQGRGEDLSDYPELFSEVAPEVPQEAPQDVQQQPGHGLDWPEQPGEYDQQDPWYQGEEEGAQQPQYAIHPDQFYVENGGVQHHNGVGDVSQDYPDGEDSYYVDEQEAEVPTNGVVGNSSGSLESSIPFTDESLDFDSSFLGGAWDRDELNLALLSMNLRVTSPIPIPVQSTSLQHEAGEPEAVQHEGDSPDSTERPNIMDLLETRFGKKTCEEGLSKIRRSIQKKRLIAKLKKILEAKDAVTVLHELHHGLEINCTENKADDNEIVYTVNLQVDGQVFKGTGASKMAAEQAGCEAALMALLLKKLAESNVETAQYFVDINGSEEADNKEDVDGPGTSHASGSGDHSPGPSTSHASGSGDHSPPGPSTSHASGSGNHSPPEEDEEWSTEEDALWSALASFALDELFAERRSGDGELLECSSPNDGLQGTQVGPSLIRPISENQNQVDSVELLDHLLPGTQYVLTTEGANDLWTYTYTVTIGSNTFSGEGNTPQEAKELCARYVLEHLGVVYID